MRRSDSGRPTPDTRLSNWRKNFILIATWHAVGGSKLHMPCVWRSDRSRSGSKIGGWSGKRSTKWPPWMPCRCIKCIPLWHISTILTYRPWACTSLGLNTLTLQRASSIDTVFINNCYEQNKQTNERPKLQRTNNKLFLTILLHTYTTTSTTQTQMTKQKEKTTLCWISLSFSNNLPYNSYPHKCPVELYLAIFLFVINVNLYKQNVGKGYIYQTQLRYLFYLLLFKYWFFLLFYMKDKFSFF